ncbi:MAG: rhomboid family intramembrane serine protease [bacterium]
MSLGRNSQNFSNAFSTIPFEITHQIDIPPSVPFPVFFTLFTSMFLYSGFMHIGGNMLYLLKNE